MFKLYKNNAEIYTDRYWTHCISQIILDFFGKNIVKSINCYYLNPEFSFITKNKKEYKFSLYEENAYKRFLNIFSSNNKTKNDEFDNIRKLKSDYKLSNCIYKIKKYE